MGNTSRLKIPYPEQSSFNDVPTDILKVATLVDELMAVGLQGQRSQRPPASKYGRFYWATDSETLSWDDGTQWRELGEPPGVIKMYFGATAPAGHLLMKGQTVNTVSYPVLAALWGNSGPTMVIPDFTDLVPRGASGPMNATGGADTVQLTQSNLPFVEPMVDGDGGLRVVVTATGPQSQSLAGPVSSGGVAFSDIDTFGGGSSPVNIVPHHRTVNFIVRAY